MHIHIKLCIRGSVNQCACKMSPITAQAKQVGRRWHMLIVIPRGYDYLQKTQSDARYACQAFPFLYVQLTITVAGLSLAILGNFWANGATTWDRK